MILAIVDKIIITLVVTPTLVQGRVVIIIIIIFVIIIIIII